MHRFYFSRIGLCSAAGEDSPSPAGGAPLSIGDQIKAAIASKASLQRQLDEASSAVANLTSTLGTTTAQVETLKSDLATRDVRIADLERQLNESKSQHALAITAKDGEIDQLKAQATTVKDQLAQLGVPGSQLPKKDNTPPGAASTKEEKLQDIQTRIDASADPKEKGVLAKEWWSVYRGETEVGKN